MIKKMGRRTRILSILLILLLLFSVVWLERCSFLRSTDSIEIVFMSDRGRLGWLRLRAMNASGREVGPLRDTESPGFNGATWSPDGMTLAFQSLMPTHHQGIALVEISENGTSRTDYGEYRYSPAWSPDGQYLAYYTDCDGRSALSISKFNIDEETDLVTDLPDRLIDGTIYEVRTSWAPDSQSLAYDVRDEQGGYEIWVVSRDGKSNQFLTEGSEPAWSPTRDEIAFERDGDIWILALLTGQESKIVDDPVRANWPAWSPTGDQLLFVSWRDDSEENRQTAIANTEIYRINRDGTGLRNLTRNKAWDAFPSWRPAPSE